MCDRLAMVAPFALLTVNGVMARPLGGWFLPATLAAVFLSMAGLASACVRHELRKRT